MMSKTASKRKQHSTENIIQKKTESNTATASILEDSIKQKKTHKQKQNPRENSLYQKTASSRRQRSTRKRIKQERTSMSKQHLIGNNIQLKQIRQKTAFGRNHYLTDPSRRESNYCSLNNTFCVILLFMLRKWFSLSISRLRKLERAGGMKYK